MLCNDHHVNDWYFPHYCTTQCQHKGTPDRSLANSLWRRLLLGDGCDQQRQLYAIVAAKLRMQQLARPSPYLAGLDG